MSEHIILLHGLWMRGLALTALRHRFESAKFEVDSFSYLSVTAPLQETLDGLRARMRDIDAPVHIVGHSLGGLLGLMACHGQTDLPPGRIVCLGSPLIGSGAAHQLAEWGGAWLLGHNRDVLEHGIRTWDGAREVGVVAGSTPLGLGAMFGQFEGDHDGTVSVAETRLPGIRDHCVVPASHTGLLFSNEAAAQAENFLRHGHFEHR